MVAKSHRKMAQAISGIGEASAGRVGSRACAGNAGCARAPLAENERTGSGESEKDDLRIGR